MKWCTDDKYSNQERGREREIDGVRIQIEYNLKSAQAMFERNECCGFNEAPVNGCASVYIVGADGWMVHLVAK